MPLNLVLPVQGRGRNLPRLYSATPLSDWELSMTKKGTAFPKKENVHKKQLYCNMYITCELHKMQLALNIKHTVCLDCVCVCLSAVCLFVVKLACVYSKTGFRFQLQPPSLHMKYRLQKQVFPGSVKTLCLWMLGLVWMCNDARGRGVFVSLWTTFFFLQVYILAWMCSCFLKAKKCPHNV